MRITSPTLRDRRNEMVSGHLHPPLQPAAIGLTNLIYPAPTGACYEQIVRLKLLPRITA